MPGPPPKPAAQRRRRNAAPAETTIPSRGRAGDAPAWPLEGEPTDAEVRLWSELWATSHAVAWERLGWIRTVARYCRITIQAEAPEATAKALVECRNLEDRLGLTPLAMRRLMWKIDDRDEPGEKRTEGQSSRDRMRLVDPDAVARP